MNEPWVKSCFKAHWSVEKGTIDQLFKKWSYVRLIANYFNDQFDTLLR